MLEGPGSRSPRAGVSEPAWAGLRAGTTGQVGREGGSEQSRHRRSTDQRLFCFPEKERLPQGVSLLVKFQGGPLSRLLHQRKLPQSSKAGSEPSQQVSPPGGRVTLRPFHSLPTPLNWPGQ